MNTTIEVFELSPCQGFSGAIFKVFWPPDGQKSCILTKIQSDFTCKLVDTTIKFDENQTNNFWDIPVPPYTCGLLNTHARFHGN